MDLRSYSDDVLLSETDRVVQREREITTAVLHHIREVERRRLFSALKFSSLSQYMIERLHYSEDQAHRRISAMRLLQELPELEPKLQAGELSLTSLNMARTLFRKEKKQGKEYSKDQKLELLERLENKPAREAAKVIVSKFLRKRSRTIRSGRFLKAKLK